MVFQHGESDEQLNEELGGGQDQGRLQNKLVMPCESNGSQTDCIIKQVYV